MPFKYELAYVLKYVLTYLQEAESRIIRVEKKFYYEAPSLPQPSPRCPPLRALIHLAPHTPCTRTGPTETSTHKRNPLATLPPIQTPHPLAFAACRHARDRWCTRLCSGRLTQSDTADSYLSSK